MGKIKNAGFQALTLTNSGLARCLICDVELFAAFDFSQHEKNFPYKPYNTKALWDTGATNTVVTASTAKEMGLIPSGQANMKHANDEVTCNTYLINLVLPNKVRIQGIPVFECQTVDGGWGAIIGMDIITKGDFSITNINNKTVFSFRFPSTKTIDYVVESHKIMFADYGKNSPCYCGAKDENGKPKKFKLCCMEKLKLL